MPPHSDADAFLEAVTLTWSIFERADLERGADLLRQDPALATTSTATLAVTGRAEEVAAVLASEPAAVEAGVGPRGWPPLLWLCAGRLGLVAPDLAGDPVATAEVLLNAGADPHAGFLWGGQLPPFTALACALGGGERGEPPHPRAVDLAELLLDAGGDPNDGQALYDRIFSPDDDHLGPLLRHGLGGPHQPSPWLERHGAALAAPEELVGDHLCFAAESGFPARVRLLLDHGVDPGRPGAHPVLGGRTPSQLAWRSGNRDVAAALAAAGAETHVDDADRLVGAAAAGDRGELTQLLDRGVDVNACAADGRTALHAAAISGDAELCRWLLGRGADPTRVDATYGATPAGWAEHGGHEDLATELAER